MLPIWYTEKRAEAFCSSPSSLAYPWYSTMRRFTLWVSFVLYIGVGITFLPADDGAGEAFFEAKIRPVLVSQCYECHSEASKEPKGGLLLDTREGIRRGGDSGHAVVPKDFEEG